MYFLLAAALFAAAAYAAPNPTVTIASGVVVGTATSVSNQPTVTALANAYLGIPFAAAPTGSLRFAPPVAASSWSNPLAAQTLPPICLQNVGVGPVADKAKQFFNNPINNPAPVENEDCLYLNVFAPQGANSTNLKTVMFWLFGGNLASGGASLAFYNGSSLAVNEDVVVVVPNYRTNIFGFSSSPQIEPNFQNSGLLDQRFALQWVQDNIAAFGGDPSKVTLFGESAGGYSIKQLLAHPPSPLPFRAAIMESQQEGLSGNGTVAYNQVVANFNCQSDDSPIDCLRRVPATQISQYINQAGLNFPPVIDNTYSASNTLPQIQDGSFAPVPVLIGTNTDEARVFLALYGLDNGTAIAEGVFALTGTNVSSILDPLLANLTGQGIDGAYLIISRIATDLAYTCTTMTFSSAIAAAGRQPVWRYRFDGEFPNVSQFNQAGAYHTIEIPEVWGTYPQGGATSDQIQLSKVMQGIWAGFAKDPEAGPGWPKLGSNLGVELGVLGGVYDRSGEATRPLLEADYLCPLLDPLFLPPVGNGGF